MMQMICDIIYLQSNLIQHNQKDFKNYFVIKLFEIFFTSKRAIT